MIEFYNWTFLKQKEIFIIFLNKITNMSYMFHSIMLK